MINSSGLSTNSPAGTHDSHTHASTMWIGGDGDGGLGGPTGTPPNVASQEVVFDLGGTHDLTGAYVWNQNQVHPSATTLYQSRGTKNFDLYVSSDTDPNTATWTPMGSKTLAVAGGTVAEPSQWVPFDASGARLVKFDIQTAHSGAANEYVGLSEVRFESASPPPPPPAFITGVTIEDVSSEVLNLVPRDAVFAIDGSGFDEGNGFHSTTANDTMWTSAGNIAGEPGFPDPLAGGVHITFDLEGNYDLSSLKVWNFNEPSALTAGARAVGISVAASEGGAFTSLLNTEFNQAPGNAALDFGQVVDLSSFAAADNARLVRFDITTNWGFTNNDGLVGLSEVRFDGAMTTAPPPPTPGGLLFHDDFDANTPNTYNVNTDIGRQTGSLAPTQYLQSGGAGSYTHQLQNVNAPDQLLLADWGTVAPDFNFNEDYSEGGLLISFDVDPTPSNYPTRDPMDWGAINLGASHADALTSVNAASEHLGLGFRGNGQMFAFDGSTYLTPSELIYTSSPGPGMKHIEILLTGVGDNNPFDGAGDTLIEVFGDVNGFSTPVYSYTKVGGYADNYVGLQGYLIAAHFDNFQIEQLEAVPEPSSFALGFLGLLGLGWYGRRWRRH